MRVAILLTLAVLVAIPSASAAETKPTKAQVRKQARKLQTPRVATCVSALRGIAWYSLRYGDWMALRGHEASGVVSRPHGCAHARWKASQWRAKSYDARQDYYRWREERMLHDFSVRAGNNAWQRAVDETQRAYPNTDWWLLSCSAAEGGWGRWVPNSQGSGVGGWMQMYPSTFWRMFSAAKADVEARDFIVPDSAASWYSPLGQALGSAWGLTHGRRGEWAGSGC